MEYLSLAALTAILPNILAAVAILIVGWIVAAIVAAIIRGLLHRTALDNRIARALSGGGAGAGAARTAPPVESGIAKGVYYLILVFAVIAALQALNLTAVATPLNSFLAQVLSYVPSLIGAAVLAVVAWIVATLARTIVARFLATAQLERRLREASIDSDATPTRYGSEAGGAAPTQMTRRADNRADAVAVSPPPPPAAETTRPAGTGDGRALSETLADVVYWLVWLLFLPAILDALQLEGVLAPVQTMLDRALAFLPNLVAAAVLLVVGWFVGRLVQRIVSGLLASVGVDGLADRVGIRGALGSQRLSALLGLIAYVLVFLPIVVAALNALQLEAVTAPVSNMLNAILVSIPNILAAALVLVIAFVVGRMVAGLVAGLLAGIGFDELPARLGLARVSRVAPAAGRTPASGAGEAAAGGQRPSQLAGNLVLVATMLFATIEAARFLGFALVADLVAQFLVFAGHILAGLAIFAIALWLAQLAADLVRASGVQQAGLLGLTARAAVLVLGGAMALRQMGLADEIVNLAFGLLLGAVALASALAFGLGGREVAGEELREWRAELRRDGRDGVGGAAGAASLSARTPGGEAGTGGAAPPRPPASPNPPARAA